MKQPLRIASILLALAAFAIASNAIPPLVTTLSDEFQIPFERFGFAFFAQFLAFASASAIIAAGTKGRFGEKILVFSLVASAILFLAAPLLRGFAAVLIWIVPLGVAGGFTETQATILLGRVDGNDSSRLVSLSQAFFCMGAIAAPQIVSVMLAKNVPWQRAFVIFAVIVGTVALAGAVSLLRRPSGDLGPAKQGPRSPGGAESSPRYSPKLRRFILAGLALAMFFYVVAEGSIIAWIAAYFEIRFGVAPAAAARRISLFWAGVLVGRLAVFVLPKRWSLWPSLLFSAAAVTVSLAVVAAISGEHGATTVIVIAGLMAGPVWPVLVSTGRTMLRGEGAVAAIVTAGAVGVAVGPFISSRFITVFGMERLFTFVLGCSVIVTVFVYTVYARTRRYDVLNRRAHEE